MSTSKKGREEPKQELRRRQGKRERQRPRQAQVSARFVRPDIHGEVQYIIQRAQAADARIVTLGTLVLFSTESRDAWLLDADDSFALRLCRQGEQQSYRIVDAPETFAIEWTADFSIDNDAFVVSERSGRVVVIHGYPIAQIAAACRGATHA
ncbi:MAG: hypothetical protein L0Y58_25410 [Verrucomicrobia subdivision 3 bacterium]|nr:hypothetical protein [Gemmataceae bacterium]MCI0748760.1 hypothetical protein [Limisphaerales bacterium]